MDYLPTIADGIPELGIIEKDGKAWTSTRDLARVFEKRHDHVIRDIREKILPNVDSDFNAPNFGGVKYKDSKGEKRPMYLLTWKAFTLVVMGYTGKRAMDFKTKFIDAFDSMKTLIETRFISREGYNEMSRAVKKYVEGSYKYSEEANLVNKIVLGMTSSQFKELYGLKKNESPRDHAVKEKLNKLDSAQRLNAQLITAKIPRTQRQLIIETNYKGK